MSIENKKVNKNYIITFIVVIVLFVVFIFIAFFNFNKEYESFFIKRNNSYELYNSLGNKLFKGKIINYTPFENNTSLILSNKIYYLINKNGKILRKFKTNEFVEKKGDLYISSSNKNEKIIYNYKGKKVLEKKSFNVERMSEFSNLYMIFDDKQYSFYKDNGEKILELKKTPDSFITPNSVINDNDKCYLSFVYKNNTYIYNGVDIEKIKNEYRLIDLYDNNYILKNLNDEFRYYIYSDDKISGYFPHSDCNENRLTIDNNYVFCKDTYNLYKFDGTVLFEGLSTYVDANKYSYMTYEKDKYVLKVKNGNKENIVNASDVVDVNSSDRIIIKNEKNKYDIVNYDGIKLNSTSFKYIHAISDSNNFIIEDSKSNYIINQNGNTISKRYKSIINYDNSYLMGQNKNNFELINKDGKVIISKIKKIYDSNSKFIYMKKDGYYMIYNLNLKKVVYQSRNKQNIIINDNYYIIKNQINSKVFFENGKALIY